MLSFRKFSFTLITFLALVALTGCGGGDSGGSAAAPVPLKMVTFSATTALAGGISSITVTTTGPVGGVSVGGVLMDFIANPGGFPYFKSFGTMSTLTQSTTTPGTWTGTLTMPTVPGAYVPFIHLLDGAGVKLVEYMTDLPFRHGSGTWKETTLDATGNSINSVDTGITASQYLVSGTVNPYPALTSISANPTTVTAGGTFDVSVTPSTNTTLVLVNLVDGMGMIVAGGFAPMVSGPVATVTVPVGTPAGVYSLWLEAYDQGGNITEFYKSPTSATMFTTDNISGYTGGVITMPAASTLALVPITVN